MPSFQDSAFIILLGLLLFGPKGLAKIARQLGKLVGEFRRASAEFRMQMEDELRIAEQADQQKKIVAMQAAAPVTPLIPSDIPEPEHPHMPPPESAPLTDSLATPDLEPQAVANPLPIATSGDLNLMPPSTGLPIGRSDPGRSDSGRSDSGRSDSGRSDPSRSASSASLNGVFDSIPEAFEAPNHKPDHTAPHPPVEIPAEEVSANG